MAWKEYYTKMNLEPRPTLARALSYFENNIPNEKCAIDLGCGNGKDTLALLKEGWNVYAIDSSPEAIEQVELNIDPILRNNLTLECKTFEEVTWKATTLINASLSLPFCPEKIFDNVWKQLTESINPGGIFTGHFFGENDDWKSLFLIRKQDLSQLFKGFEIEYLSETEENKESATGPVKHWHIFEVMAIKK